MCVFADFSGAFLALLAVVSWQPLQPALGPWGPPLLLMWPSYRLLAASGLGVPPAIFLI